VRYHSERSERVFAARSSWRALVTPKPPDGVARRKNKPNACGDDPLAGAPIAAPAPAAPSPASITPQAGANDGAPAPPPQAPAPAAATAAASAMPAPTATPGASDLRAVAMASGDPTMTTVEHWRRILDEELYAASSRVEWAPLLRRTYGVDALRCPKCTARMRVMATITEPDAVKKILAHLNLPTEPLPRARARDPTGQKSFDFHAA